jgi:hypothetical protein
MPDIRAIMVKEDLMSVIGFFYVSDRYYLTIWDPRQERPAIQEGEDRKAMEKAFYRAIELSKERGWSLIYFGKPNYG